MSGASDLGRTGSQDGFGKTGREKNLGLMVWGLGFRVHGFGAEADA